MELTALRTYLTDALAVVEQVATLTAEAQAQEQRLAKATYEAESVEQETQAKLATFNKKIEIARGTADQLIDNAKKQAEREITEGVSRCQALTADAQASLMQVTKQLAEKQTALDTVTKALEVAKLEHLQRQAAVEAMRKTMGQLVNA